MSMCMMRRHRVWAVTEQLRCHEIMELFQRLAEGHAARITVVTPNRRLAQALTAEFDAFQIGKGLSVWEAPDILPFGAFVERLWEDALYSELGDKLPLLLTPAQEQLLWQEVIAPSREGKDLLFTETAAAHCRDAWGLLHQWRIGAARGNEDHSAFSEWARQYQKETLGDVDSARLPDLVAGLLDRLKKPKLLVAYAFDLVPPQTAEFLRHFECVEVKPEVVQGSSSRTSFASAKEELEYAAKWTRARLRRKLEATVALPKLIAFAEPCPLLRQALERVFALAGEAGEKSPSEWARRFSALLEAAGFPGERALDSEEFQARAKWHEVLGEFARLDRISKNLSLRKALSILKQICSDTLFQPESADAPIQVLGVLESAGLRFDCLWVSGLTDEAWPLAARPNPFIPIALQKKAGIPQASAEGSLAFGRRITQEWAGSAKEVVFSWPGKEEDRDLAPSPLILEIPVSSLSVPDYPRYRDLLFASKKLESLEDSKAPPVQVKQVRGGTRVLTDQAACPFRAFARWRLAAEGLEEPTPGLDARKRGSLLHHLMKHLWSR